ncbi:MAG TPA: tetratricopeptide repeat protein [Candidatus Obscuribacterales bacterium]
MAAASISGLGEPVTATVTHCRTAGDLAGSGCVFAKAARVALLACLVVAGSQAGAADFSRAQKIYVPPTKIERRLDFAALREREAAAGHYSTSQYLPPAGSLPSAPVKVSKSGLVPPPPPVAPTILPAGHASTIVPPPPPATPLIASSPQPGASSTQRSIQAAARKVAGSTTSFASGARARAQELIKQGNLEEADSVLRNAFKTAPRDALVKRDLAALSMQRAEKFLAGKDLDSALKAAREAVYVDPSSSQASALLDKILSDSGVNPSDAAERIRAADLLASQGRDTAATVEYRAALKLKPSAAAHVGLGNLAARSGQKALAKSEYLKAIEAEPGSAAAHRQLGLLELSANDTVGANTDLSRAVILDPQDKIAGKALVDLWQRQVSRAPNDANAHLGLARAYQLTGDLKSAQSEYRQVVRIDPNHPNLPAARQSFKLALARQEAERNLQAARTLEGQGALAAAHDKVLEALSLNPADASTRLYQGQLLEKMGQPQQARNAYMEVLREDPNNIFAAQRLKALPGGAAQAPIAGAPALASGEAPPLSSIPPARVDHVTSLSNFLVSLRNHSLAEKNRLEGIEDHARKRLGSITHDVLGTPGLSSPGAGPVASAAPVQAPGPFSAPAAIAASALGSTGLSALAGAATGGFAGGGGGASPSPAGASAGTGAATHLLSGAPTNAAPPPAAYEEKVRQLEEQNRQLKTQLEQVQRSIQTMQVPAAYQGHTAGRQAGPPAAPPFAAAGFANPLAAPQAALSGRPLTAPGGASGPAVAPPGGLPLGTFQPAAGAPIAALPSFMPPAAAVGTPVSAAPAAAPLGVPQSLKGMPAGVVPQAPPVRLELEGLKPSGNSVLLKVVLRNDRDTALDLPATAIFRSATAPDTPVKMSFPARAVPPHSQLHGTIKVPRQQLDPSADLFIPHLLPAASGMPDVRLTVPVVATGS